MLYTGVATCYNEARDSHSRIFPKVPYRPAVPVACLPGKAAFRPTVGGGIHAEGGEAVAGWRLETAANSHPGAQREVNDGCVYLNGRWLAPEVAARGGRLLGQSSGAFQVYAVCDGKNGGRVGAQAGEAALRALYAMQSAYPGGVTDAVLMAALCTLTDAVCAMPGDGANRPRTTLAACLWRRAHMRVLSIGDSRVYRLRDGRLTPLTVDHTQAQRLVAQGNMAPDQAAVSRERHVLEQYIGLPAYHEDFRPYLSMAIPVYTGDRYLLCSHGLTDMVEDGALRHALLLAKTPGHAVDVLVQAALDNGGQENMTAVCLWVRGSGGFGWRARLAMLRTRLKGGL